MPVVPVKAAGWRIEPPVSVPVAAGHRRAAIAAEEPPDEPPGVSAALSPSRRQGEVTLPNALLSLLEPIANWSRLSLPNMPAPASHSFCETVDSYSGVKPSRILLAAEVCTPLVANRSFMPIGTPASLPSALPAARSASTLRAASSAASGVVTIKALSAACASATAPLKAVATSTAVKSPLATPSRICVRVSSVRFVIIRSPWARQRSHVRQQAHWPAQHRGYRRP